MSIFIKTMTNLPEHCYDCPCHNGESGYCQADKEHKYSDYRPFWCPLAYYELPSITPIKRKGLKDFLDEDPTLTESEMYII